MGFPSLFFDVRDVRALFCKGEVSFVKAKLGGQTRERVESLKGPGNISLG